jgi:hypothetical protein
LTQQSELEKIFILPIPFHEAFFNLSPCRTNLKKQPMKGKTANRDKEQWSRQRTRERQKREREKEKQSGAVTLGCEHQAKIRKGFWVRISFPSAKCKLVFIQISIVNLNNNALKCKPKNSAYLWAQ